MCATIIKVCITNLETKLETKIWHTKYKRVQKQWLNMSVTNSRRMVLTETQLNDMDRAVLDLLAEGRVTPSLAQTYLTKREIADTSAQYINQRLKRLAEHGHVTNLEGSGVYEIVRDPREDQEDDEDE
jgi:hypothetical protein